MADAPMPGLPSIRRRLICMVYEALLLLGITAALIVPLMFYSVATGSFLPHAVLRVYFFLGLAVYFLWHWSGLRQTLAMRTWKIMIAMPDGTRPPLWRLALRYALAWPSVAFGAGLVWALVDRDRQFLHDRLAGTHIIFAPPTRS